MKPWRLINFFMPSCRVLTQPQQILVFSDSERGFMYRVGFSYVFFLKLAGSQVSRKKPKQWTIKKINFFPTSVYGCVVMSSVVFIRRSFHEGIQWSFLQLGRNLFRWSKPLIFTFFEMNTDGYFKRCGKWQKTCSGSSLITFVQCCVLSFLNGTVDWYSHTRKKTKLHLS